MLLTSARLRPCKALALASSPCRLTTTLPSCTLRLVRLGNSQSSLPLGPSTWTDWPLTSTFTFAGIVMGCLPIRDICEKILVTMSYYQLPWVTIGYQRLPYVAEQF